MTKHITKGMDEDKELKSEKDRSWIMMHNISLYFLKRCVLRADLKTSGADTDRRMYRQF